MKEITNQPLPSKGYDGHDPLSWPSLVLYVELIFYLKPLKLLIVCLLKESLSPL